MERTNDPPDAPVDAVVRPPQFCSDCGKIHAFRTPKFAIGQRVRLASNDRGLHHMDRLGEETVITSICIHWVEPCDEPEYGTGFGGGFILEGRIEAV